MLSFGSYESVRVSVSKMMHFNILNCISNRYQLTHSCSSITVRSSKKTKNQQNSFFPYSFYSSCCIENHSFVILLPPDVFVDQLIALSLSFVVSRMIREQRPAFRIYCCCFVFIQQRMALTTNKNKMGINRKD